MDVLWWREVEHCGNNKKVRFATDNAAEKRSNERAERRSDATHHAHRPFNGVRDELGRRGIHGVPVRRRARSILTGGGGG